MFSIFKQATTLSSILATFCVKSKEDNLKSSVIRAEQPQGRVNNETSL